MSSVSQLTIENGKPSHLGPAGPIFSRSQNGPNSKANGRPVGSQELVPHDTRPQFVLKGSETKPGFALSQILHFRPCSLSRYFVTTSGEAASSGPILEHVTAKALSVTRIKG